MPRQLDTFGKQVAEIPPDRPVFEAVVHIVRDLTANDTNVVMYELMVAARTDEKLKATLQVVLKEYGERILETAREVPTADQYPDEVLAAVVVLLVNAFDGATLVRHVLPTPEF